MDSSTLGGAVAPTPDFWGVVPVSAVPVADAVSETLADRVAVGAPGVEVEGVEVEGVEVEGVAGAVLGTGGFVEALAASSMLARANVLPEFKAEPVAPLGLGAALATSPQIRWSSFRCQGGSRTIGRSTTALSHGAGSLLQCR